MSGISSLIACAIFAAVARASDAVDHDAALGETASPSLLAAANTTATTGGKTTAKPAKVKVKPHPEQVWIILGCLIGIATVIRLCSILWSAYRRRAFRLRKASGTTPSSSPSLPGVRSLSAVPNALLSAVRISAFRTRVYGLQMVTFEALVTLAYLAILFLWTFLQKDTVEKKSWQVNTGRLAAMQLPLVVLLSSKNNIIGFLTGVGHEKLNSLHRYLSLCLLLFVWIHLLGLYFKNPARLLDTTWRKMGLYAGVAFTLMMILSVKPIRRRSYEWFYLGHVALVLFFLVTTHLHAGPPGYGNYVWSVWLFWGLDRLARGLRSLTVNVALRPADTHAALEAVPGGAVRIALKRRVPGGWTPGQHAFLAFPTVAPLQGHPFTITTLPARGEDEEELVFVVRARGGLTRRLLERAELVGSGCRVPVFFDGPYGVPQDIRPFSTCVFIAGGTGITYALARMLQLVRDVRAGDACAERVLFVWAIRSIDELSWFNDQLKDVLKTSPPSLALAVEVYITGPATSTESLPSVADDDEKERGDPEKGFARADSLDSDTKKPLPPSDCASEKSEDAVTTEMVASGAATPATAVQVPGRPTRRCGRPQVRKILEDEVTCAAGPVSVDVSGPESLVNAVRAALCAPFAGPGAALRGMPSVQLNVEQFKM